MLSLIALVSLSLAAPKKAPAPPPPPVPAPVEAPLPPPDPLAERPVVGAEAAFALPAVDSARLSNGASVWVVPQPSLPLVTLVLAVPGGSSVDARGKEGTASLSDRLMTQGAGGKDAAAFADALARLGAQLDVTTDQTGSFITLSVLKPQLAPALDLIADMVLRPAYRSTDFKRERSLARSDLELGQEDPVTVAARLAQARWFGLDHAYGRPADGTLAGLRKVSAKDVKNYHARAWNAAGATFTVAGAVTRDEVVGLLEPRLGAAWAAGEAARRTVAPVTAPQSPPVVIVDKPGSAQTMFQLFFEGEALGAAEAAPARIGTIVLGGTFTSRLNQLLREKRGFTYGVRARSVELPGAGVYVIGTRIRTDATGPAMKDLLDELARIRGGIDADELRKARAAYRQQLVDTVASRAGLAATLAERHLAGMAPDALAVELARTSEVAVEAVAPAMAAYDAARAVIVLVGDRAAIEGPLKEAGVTSIEVVPPL
jgi:predicted Zn-dependent peptidase